MLPILQKCRVLLSPINSVRFAVKALNKSVISSTQANPLATAVAFTAAGGETTCPDHFNHLLPVGTSTDREEIL
jgi:hypothetical protein